MKFSFLNKKPDQKNKLYLGLLLKEKQAVVLVMKDDGKKLHLIEKEKLNYSNNWENLTEDVDKIVFQLEQKLGTTFQEIIFFVYSHLIDEKTKEIKKDYLIKIKNLIKNLEFKPLGYIECYEAVATYFEKKEELPLTAIITELDDGKLSTFIYKGGNLTFNKTIERTTNLTKDFVQAIEEVKGRMLLPSKIILYDSKDLDDEVTKILTYQWPEEFFIQLPRVHVVKEMEIFQGLIKVFENQIKADVSSTDKITEKNIGNKEVLGFVIGKDVIEDSEEMAEDYEKKIPEVKKSKFKINNLLVTLINKIKTFKFKGNFGGVTKKQGNKFIIIGSVLIIFGLFLNEYFFHKASLTLFVPSKKIIDEITINKNDVPIEVSTVSAVLSESKLTTGEKEIGNNAKGSVTIYNFSSSLKSFKTNTIVDSNGIKFSLDQDVNVASASNVIVGSSLVKQPGKTKISVTAVEIGPQSNIEKNHQFVLENYPQDTFMAINEEAMTGGTKKTVRTVSKKDIDELKTLILEKGLKENNSNNKIKDKVTIIDDLTQTIFSEENFTKEIGEEAETVGLQAKVNSVFYHFNNKKLIEYIKKRLVKELAAGFIIDEQKTSFKITKAKGEGEDISVSLKINAIATKEFSQLKIINDIKGKRRNDLDKIFKNNYEINGFDIVMKEPLPLINNWLPFFQKNIDLKISIL